MKCISGYIILCMRHLLHPSLSRRCRQKRTRRQLGTLLHAVRACRLCSARLVLGEADAAVCMQPFKARTRSCSAASCMGGEAGTAGASTYMPSGARPLPSLRCTRALLLTLSNCKQCCSHHSPLRAGSWSCVLNPDSRALAPTLFLTTQKWPLTSTQLLAEFSPLRSGKGGWRGRGRGPQNLCIRLRATCGAGQWHAACWARHKIPGQCRLTVGLRVTQALYGRPWRGDSLIRWLECWGWPQSCQP